VQGVQRCSCCSLQNGFLQGDVAVFQKIVRFPERNLYIHDGNFHKKIQRIKEEFESAWPVLPPPNMFMWKTEWKLPDNTGGTFLVGLREDHGKRNLRIKRLQESRAPFTYLLDYSYPAMLMNILKPL
jgi:hypothetical protein